MHVNIIGYLRMRDSAENSVSKYVCQTCLVYFIFTLLWEKTRGSLANMLF